MVVAAPPRSPEPEPVEADALDALIEEARRRARRRRIGYAACALTALVGAAIFFGLHGGAGSTVSSAQNEPPAAPRAAPSQRASSGFIAIARVYRGESHILLVDPSGQGALHDLGRGSAPSWSPDGRKLVFEYDMSRGGRSLRRIFVMNADGSGRHLLRVPSVASEWFEDWAPAWSPDGRRIVFTRTVHVRDDAVNGRTAIYVLDLVHGGLRRAALLSDNGELFPLGATWSPDGRRLAYLRDSGQFFSHEGISYGCLTLHVSNADGAGDHVLAAASRLPNDCLGIGAPAWSPDGRSIAFARSPHPGSGTDLYLISADGKRLQRLTHQPNLISGNPTWSADGKRIAFVFGRRDRGGPGPGGPNRIRSVVVIDRDGGNRHTVVRLRGHISGGPAW
jgi:Tol biopolymer transport system component